AVDTVESGVLAQPSWTDRALGGRDDWSPGRWHARGRLRRPGDRSTSLSSHPDEVPVQAGAVARRADSSAISQPPGGSSADRIASGNARSARRTWKRTAHRGTFADGGKGRKGRSDCFRFRPNAVRPGSPR